MKIGVVYAAPTRQAWLSVEVLDGATVRDAIERSGILQQFPEIDLEQQKVGIFSKLTKLDAALADGDRIEIYRPITCDPKTVKRKAKTEGEEEASEG
ncbi:protein RnfH [Sulfuricella sp. T08]|uniref:RnfH family protein n=1 Tax=Sulfuricella sp. T08 TaxID=1632857 RepID=UPI00061796B6|nr:RnfH family protein [Sulfuricella sp. T08]GAO37629.1 protein RnfH [Sulfuricella sp. T08]